MVNKWGWGAEGEEENHDWLEDGMKKGGLEGEKWRKKEGTENVSLLLHCRQTDRHDSNKMGCNFPEQA